MRRKTLVKHFGSLKKLREAEVDEIAQVPGIGPRTASAIKDAVSRPSDQTGAGVNTDGQHRDRRADGGLMADTPPIPRPGPPTQARS